MTEPLTARQVEVTERELAVLNAYAVTGDYGQAAAMLGTTRGAVVGCLARLRRKVGVPSTVMLVYLFRDRLSA